MYSDSEIDAQSVVVLRLKGTGFSPYVISSKKTPVLYRPGKNPTALKGHGFSRAIKSVESVRLQPLRDGFLPQFGVLPQPLWP
jgi:hypothetical protein